MGSDVTLEKKRILVTGGTGYLGSWMAELAYRAGNDVRLLVRRVPDHLSRWARKFDVVEGDILESDSLGRACRGREVVWHTASLDARKAAGDMNAAIQTNVVGTVNVLKSAAAAGVEIFVKFSTLRVYGLRGGTRVTEDCPPLPNSVYGLTNLMGDQTARYFGMREEIRVRIPRLSNGYGAPLSLGIDRWDVVVNEITRMAFEQKEIVLRSSGVQHRDFIAIADIFSAVCLLSKNEVAHDIFNVGSGISRSIMEVSCLVRDTYKNRFGEEIPIRTRDAIQAEVVAPVKFDIHRLRSLGYRPTDPMPDEIGAIFDLLEAGEVIP